MYKTSHTLNTDKPFRLDLTVWVLRRRDKNIVDKWIDGVYSRLLVVNNSRAIVKLTQTGSKTIKTKLLSREPIPKETADLISNNLRKILGIDKDITPFYTIASKSSMLDQVALKFKGMRPTRYPSIFEALVNAVACQQVSLEAGLSILNRLIEKTGQSMNDDSGTTYYSFPEPNDVIDLSEATFRELGFSMQKTKAIKKIAFAMLNDDFNIEKAKALSNNDLKKELLELHGIGRWSAEYVMLRGFGRIDIFPGDDVGAQNNIRELMAMANRPSYDQIKNIMDSWKPYAGLVYFHMLLNKLHDKNYIKL